ncbi:fission protein Fis1 [Schizosaccharomyces japonicus yFS275]|uniref:Mitochondrial fission 1 protein n=1 Tax=Schizosaccharomyces japonicus (strain yFS275 / FY16936) TaxID=402676 RepID=B6K4B0_SCHJY|nr:fission protein Fis1 [Schizosaccharomyces japonicus yFS275]EEB08317.1 fission protein Fis1 [Schizosaccharomyces japonicus yFS275]
MSTSEIHIRLPPPTAVRREVPVEEYLQVKESYDKEKPIVSVQTQFNLAWVLIRSSSEHQQRQGLNLFSSIYKEVPERRLECLYYISLAYYKLFEYDEARRYIDMFLAKEPKNNEAALLREMIHHDVKKGLYEGEGGFDGVENGYIGMAIVAGTVFSGAALFGWVTKKLFFNRSKK